MSTVNVNPTSNTITVIDNGTQIITVNTQGPQGPAGADGEPGASGSQGPSGSTDVPTGTVSGSTQISLLGFVTSSATASFVVNSQTSSMSVLSSSYALTASHALNSGGGSGDGFPYTGSAAISGTLSVEGPAGHITASGNIKGSDLFLTGGDIDLKNAGAQSNIKFYCESSNAHYTQLQAASHSEYSGNPTATLPAYDFDFAAPNFQGNVTASNNISASGTITALTGSFSHLKGNSPITVGDSITFQQPITSSIISASIISASTFSGDGSGLANVPESTDIDVYLNFEEARSYAYIVPYNLQFAGFTTSSAMTVQISSSGASYVFTSSLSQFSTLSVTSSAAGLITLSGSKL